MPESPYFISQDGRPIFPNYVYQFHNPLLSGRLGKIKEIQDPTNRIKSLLSRLQIHHLDTAIHSLEVTTIACNLARYLGLSDNLQLKLFNGGIVHDVGKLDVDVAILNRNRQLLPEEKSKLTRHGRTGGAILEIVGLGDFAPFATEHHIGNSSMSDWTREQLQARHPLVEVVAIADFLAASLDYRRKYKQPNSLENIVQSIRLKTEKGIFSPELEIAFLRYVSKHKLPPFNMSDISQDETIKRFFDTR